MRVGGEERNSNTYNSFAAVDASKEREFLATGGSEKDRTVKFWVPAETPDN